MLISFIIPYYNEPLALITECISSILELHLADNEREIIVVDDGSKESVEAQLTAICPNLKYIKQSNQGLSAARNAGLDHANGEFIQFVDSDDTLLSAYNQVIEILKEKRPDILQFQFTRNRKHAESTQHDAIISDTTGAEYLCNHNLHAAACGYLFRKNMLNELRFKVGIYHEDELFTPQLFARASRVIVTSITAYYYRLRDNSITTSRDMAKTQKRLDDMLYVIRSLKALDNATLHRRIHQITMDYTYNVWHQTRNVKHWHQRRATLKNENLYPLPLHRYTWKYLAFAMLTRII